MRWLLLFGRLLFGGLALWTAWQQVAHADGLAVTLAAHSVPVPETAVWISTLLLALGGVSILLGFQPRVGLALIALFLASTTGVMYAWWTVEPAAIYASLALLGATLSMMALPCPWPLSLDAWLARSGDPFDGDMFGRIKRQLKLTWDAVRPRPASVEHAQLVASHEQEQEHPTPAFYVTRRLVADRDGSVLFHQVRGYYRW